MKERNLKDFNLWTNTHCSFVPNCDFFTFLGIRVWKCLQMFDCLEKKVESFNLANNSLGGKILHSTIPRKDELSFGVAIVTH